MNRKGIVLIALLLIIGGMIAYQFFPKSEDETLKIGAALGLTGDAAVWGEASRNGAELAVNEINRNGGVNGRKIELIVEDTKSTSKDTLSAVSKLKTIDKVDSFLVTWLDVYQGSESLLPDGKIMISPDAGVEAVNGAKTHSRVFSTWYRTGPKSELAVKHMSEQGIKKLYVIVQNDSYYATAAQFIEDASHKYEVEIVGKEMLNPGTDIKTVLVKIKSAKPDAVFFAFYDEEMNFEFLKRRETYLGSKVTIYGDEFVQQNYQREDMKGLFENIFFHAPQRQERTFVDAYKAAYGKDPIFGASTSYDAVYMMAELFRDRPENIDSYMRSTTFNTVTYGEVTFDAIGGISTPSNTFTIQQIKNGIAIEAK